MKKLSLFLLFWLSCMGIYAQYKTQVLHPNEIKTLRTRYWYVADDAANANILVRPFLVMGSSGEIGEEGDAYKRLLEISFDELSHETKQYTFSLIHLNADGTQSSLMSSEYLDGFTTHDITDYDHSLNTSQLYTHYRFTFPTTDMHIKASGNYAIKIYEDYDEDKVVAYVCFSVVQPTTNTQVQVRTNTDIEISGRYQQLDLDLTLPINSRAEDYFVVVRQNGRLDNEVFQPKPNYIGTQRIRFDHCKELIFEGGNEYRHFDTYSRYFAGAHVYKITHDHVDYHAQLEQDELWGQGARYSGDVVTDVCGTPYMHEYDVNGQYIINAERTVYDIETEAEYMWVHWFLAAEQPWLDGILFVGGDLFLNELSLANRMTYDNERRGYYLDAFVKQGGHDYQYWFVPTTTKKVTLQRTEGSHWETGNEYTIYVYYKPIGSRYDQLVGLTVIK